MNQLWNPFDTSSFGLRPVPSLFHDLERLFGDVDHWLSADRADAFPRISNQTTAEAYELSVDLPGLTDKDVTLNVQDNVLTLSAVRNVSTPDGYALRHRERAGSQFTRKLRIPAQVDSEKIEARMSNGVLTLTLPKRGEAKPRPIDVKSN
jgi:HSP20 family protein